MDLNGKQYTRLLIAACLSLPLFAFASPQAEWHSACGPVHCDGAMFQYPIAGGGARPLPRTNGLGKEPERMTRSGLVWQRSVAFCGMVQIMPNDGLATSAGAEHWRPAACCLPRARLLLAGA